MLACVIYCARVGRRQGAWWLPPDRCRPLGLHSFGFSRHFGVLKGLRQTLGFLPVQRLRTARVAAQGPFCNFAAKSEITFAGSVPLSSHATGIPRNSKEPALPKSVRSKAGLALARDALVSPQSPARFSRVRASPQSCALGGVGYKFVSLRDPPQ
jgi:hypothetical protein